MIAANIGLSHDMWCVYSHILLVLNNKHAEFTEECSLSSSKISSEYRWPNYIHGNEISLYTSRQGAIDVIIHNSKYIYSSY